MVEMSTATVSLCSVLFVIIATLGVTDSFTVGGRVLSKAVPTVKYGGVATTLQASNGDGRPGARGIPPDGPGGPQRGRNGANGRPDRSGMGGSGSEAMPRPSRQQQQAMNRPPPSGSGAAFREGPSPAFRERSTQQQQQQQRPNFAEQRSDPRNSPLARPDAPPPPRRDEMPPPPNMQRERMEERQRIDSVRDYGEPVTVQGRTLRTWSVSNPRVERMEVMIENDGFPVNANIDLWQGPNYSPQRIKLFVQDGYKNPFRAVFETQHSQNSVALRNTGPLEFPFTARIVEADMGDERSATRVPIPGRLYEETIPQTIQGGAVNTYPFGASISSVQILLETRGRPLDAVIELLQGPNNVRQAIQVYSEDGMERPFFAVVDTPGQGNVIRVNNVAPMEFPLVACVEPYTIDEYSQQQSGPVILGGTSGGWSGGANQFQNRNSGPYSLNERRRMG